MNISFCDDREAAAYLWKTCFPEDSPDFVQFYMNRVHRTRDALLFRGADGDCRAYLGMVPYQLQMGKRTVSCSYLSGVCTLPEFRGRGYMTAMMERALRVMYDRGDVMSVLIPAKPDLYLKFGYADSFFLEQKPLPKGKGRGQRQNAVFKLHEWYEEYCSRHFDCFVRRSAEQWEILLEEHIRFEEGELWSNEGAYAIVSRFQERTVVKEAMGENRAVHALLCRIGDGVILSAESHKPFAQARVIHAEKAMEQLPDCMLRVTDPWIIENNGSFSVRDGVVTRELQGGKPITIAELSALILKGNTYMNLMLN